MAQKLREHALETILKENRKKLVCVLFTTNDAPNAERTKQWWDSIAQKYTTSLILFADCNDCQMDARKNDIKQIPTFIFFKNGTEMNRIIGRNEQQIIQFIEDNKLPGAFDGSSHTLGASPDNFSFYENLMKQKAEKAARPPAKTADPRGLNQHKKETFESNLIPNRKPAAPQQQKSFSGQSSTISSNANTPKQELTLQQKVALTRKQLLELEFPLSMIDQAIQATNFGDVDACLEYITDLQLQQKNNKPETEESHTADGRSEEKASSDGKPPPEATSALPKPTAGPKKMLSPAEQSMKEQLLSFGYLEDDINKALSCVGADSIDRLIDCISRIQNGEDPQQIATQQKQEMQQRQKLSKEDLDKRAAELKEKAQQREIEKMKQAPKLAAQKELERRKEVLEQAELRQKYAERQRQLDMEMAQKQKIRDIQERERVLAKIATQRGKKTDAASQEAAPKPAAPKKTPTECTLKINIPGNQDLIVKVPLDATFKEVDDKVRQERPYIGGQITTYTSSFPSITIRSQDFGKTVTELQLVPRTMLTLSLN